MKQTKSELILASKSESTGTILYTWKLTYPYIIHGEVMTHRVFSRNAASSRAVPMKRMRRMVLKNPFIPSNLGTNQKGMQAGAEQSGWRRKAAMLIWSTLRYPAVFGNWSFEKLGIHKQLGNRFLMPWMWMETLVSTTEVSNFFKLRDDKAAEPHFQELAKLVHEQVRQVRHIFNGDIYGDMDGGEAGFFENVTWADAYPEITKVCQTLKPGEWHMPFIDRTDRKAALELAVDEYLYDNFGLTLLKISTARCARVSYYLPEDGKRSDIKRDLELHDRLASSGHWSPFEHAATPLDTTTFLGNFRGWMQYRKEFNDESGENGAPNR